MQHLQCGTDVIFEPDYFWGPQSSSWNRPEPGHQGAAAACSKDCGDDRKGRHSPQPGEFPLPFNLILLADGAYHEARVGLTGVHLGRVALADGLTCDVAGHQRPYHVCRRGLQRGWGGHTGVVEQGLRHDV